MACGVISNEKLDIFTVLFCTLIMYMLSFENPVTVRVSNVLYTHAVLNASHKFMNVRQPVLGWQVELLLKRRVIHLLNAER